MKYEKMKRLYQVRNLMNDFDLAKQYVEDFEHYLIKNKSTLDNCTTNDLQSYLEKLIIDSKNDLQRLLALARYFHSTSQEELYIYFTSILGGLGVIENIKKRSENIIGLEKTNEIFKMKSLPLGTSTKHMPEFTKELMQALSKNLEEKVYKKILAGNNHNMPVDMMLEEKKLYEEAASLDIYLKERHDRKVKELQKYCDEDKIWFEQKITQEIVDYVKSNQEILSGVINDGKLYITKFPYNPKGFLKATTLLEKRYEYCHCSFARESIKDGNTKIPKDWCYCSAGYAKFPFEVIFNKELEVDVLESTLAGDDKCRFVIHLDKEILCQKLIKETD